MKNDPECDKKKSYLSNPMELGGTKSWNFYVNTCYWTVLHSSIRLPICLFIKVTECLLWARHCSVLGTRI